MRLKVAIDSGPLNSGHGVRGVGSYTRELIDSLKKESSNENIDIYSVEINKTDLSDFDVLHYTSFNPYYAPNYFTSNNRQRRIITIHDLIPVIFPEKYKPGIKGRLNFLKQKMFINKFNKIITPSETSKKDVMRFMDIPEEKITVISEAPSSIFKEQEKQKLLKVKKKYGLPDKFVLYVGDVNYNKNIITLVKACEKVGITLVICGKQALEVEDAGLSLVNLEGPRDYLRFLFNVPHPELAHYNNLSTEFQKKDLVKRLGFVSIDDLVSVYNLCSLYCQPSFYEGFGLPVVEAMACGVPVVVAKNNCLVELVGNNALKADPYDFESFAECFQKILKFNNLKNELKKKSLERAKEFSWTKAAKESISVYEEVSGNS